MFRTREKLRVNIEHNEIEIRRARNHVEYYNQYKSQVFISYFSLDFFSETTASSTRPTSTRSATSCTNFTTSSSAAPSISLWPSPLSVTGQSGDRLSTTIGNCYAISKRAEWFVPLGSQATLILVSTWMGSMVNKTHWIINVFYASILGKGFPLSKPES